MTLVAPGTTEFVAGYLEKQRGFRVGEDLFVAHVPERIAADRFLAEIGTLPCIVGGVGEASGERAARLFGHLGAPAELPAPDQTQDADPGDVRHRHGVGRRRQPLHRGLQQAVHRVGVACDSMAPGQPDHGVRPHRGGGPDVEQVLRAPVRREGPLRMAHHRSQLPAAAAPGAGVFGLGEQGERPLPGLLHRLPPALPGLHLLQLEPELLEDAASRRVRQGGERDIEAGRRMVNHMVQYLSHVSATCKRAGAGMVESATINAAS